MVVENLVSWNYVSCVPGPRHGHRGTVPSTRTCGVSATQVSGVPSTPTGVDAEALHQCLPAFCSSPYTAAAAAWRPPPAPRRHVWCAEADLFGHVGGLTGRRPCYGAAPGGERGRTGATLTQPVTVPVAAGVWWFWNCASAAGLNPGRHRARCRIMGRCAAAAHQVWGCTQRPYKRSLMHVSKAASSRHAYCCTSCRRQQRGPPLLHVAPLPWQAPRL